jgi:hypothetical protein
MKRILEETKNTMEKKKKRLLIETSWCFLRRFTKIPAMKLKIVHTCSIAQPSEFKIMLSSQVLYSAIQALEPMLNMHEKLNIPLQREANKNVYC